MMHTSPLSQASQLCQLEERWDACTLGAGVELWALTPHDQEAQVKLSSLKSQADYGGFGVDPAPGQVEAGLGMAQHGTRIIMDTFTLSGHSD